MFFSSIAHQMRAKAEGRVEREVKVSASARIDGDGSKIDSQDDSPPDDLQQGKCFLLPIITVGLARLLLDLQ